MPKRILLVLFLIVAAAGPAAASAVDMADYRPIADEAYTEDLRQAGYRNGDMPSIRMIDVGGCLLERDAAYTLSLMLEAARLDGVDLAAHDCYRSFSAQAGAYDRRCPFEEKDIVEVDPETGEEEVVDTVRFRTCSGPPTARPGMSNHGWGRAVDFGNGYRILSCGDAGFQWLQDNASRFGWVHPDWAMCGRATREAWHWEWGAVTEALPVAMATAEPTVRIPDRVR